MVKLKDFAAFVKENKFDEFVTSNLEMLKSFDIPIFSLLKDMDDSVLRERSEETLHQFLDGIINGNAIELAKINLKNWEEDKLPGIPKTAISVVDITQIYAAQKISLITLIPYFSSDSSDSINLVFELELHFNEMRRLAFDVLRKIQQEEQLKLFESEERYKDLFDNASDLIHIVNPEGQILYVNNAWLKSLQYTADELKGKQILEIVAERERDNYLNYRNRVLANHADAGNISTILVAKDGREIIAEGYITCKYKNGVPEYTRGILRDVTKRIEDEKKLKFYNDQLLEREENLNRLVQNAPDAIIVIDEANIIKLWNPKAEIIFGWKLEEVINTDLTQTIIPPEYRDAHNAGMKRFKATGISHVINRTIEITAINKQKKRFFISLTISQSSQAGKVTFIAFIRDISLQKQNEAELENKRKQLEKSNEELEQYAWLASHDLKEPLRKIMTFSDILLTRYAKDLPEVVQRHLNKIHDSTKRMDSLIEAIMVYSNVRDKNDLFVDVDLSQILNEVLGDLEVAIKRKKAIINADALPVIEAIKIQMRQLLQNLISNALKYSKPNVPAVIKISSTVKDGICYITISDNGIGFNNQYAEKIFQVFQRLATGERYEGTGIGLALCRKIVETHDGTIEAEGNEGEGAVFSVSLPTRHTQNEG